MQENRRVQENRKNEEFKETLRKRLEWYTYDVSDEEFDEKAVESILYLLDECDPIPQEKMPDADEMWEKFQKIARERDLLPKEETVGADAVKAGNMTAEGRLTIEGALTAEGMSGEGVEEGRRSAGEAAVGKLEEERRSRGETFGRNLEEEGRSRGETFGGNLEEERRSREEASAGNVEEGRRSTGEAAVGKLEEGRKSRGDESDGNLDECRRNAAGRLPDEKNPVLREKAGKTARIGRFVVRHKFVAAALLAIGVLAIGNTVRVAAFPETGFFFWMKKDDAGVQMITSPEGLNNKVEKQENISYSKESLPEWGQEWADTIMEVKIPQEYEWQLYMVSDGDNRQNIESYYSDINKEKTMFLGMWIYKDKVALYQEDFIDYTYVESYEVKQQRMDVYNRVEENGNIYYIVCFYEGKRKYYVYGQEDLEVLKGIIKNYWDCVKNNL